MKFKGFAPRYYTLDGETPVPCPDLLTWALWMETAPRHVGKTVLGDGLVLVSTVFLGIEHIGGALFETMVFCDDGGGDTARYRTYSEAKAGHQRMVEAWSKKVAQALIDAEAASRAPAR